MYAVNLCCVWLIGHRLADGTFNLHSIDERDAIINLAEDNNFLKINYTIGNHSSCVYFNLECVDDFYSLDNGSIIVRYITNNQVDVINVSAKEFDEQFKKYQFENKIKGVL